MNVHSGWWNLKTWAIRKTKVDKLRLHFQLPKRMESLGLLNVWEGPFSLLRWLQKSQIIQERWTTDNRVKTIRKMPKKCFKLYRRSKWVKLFIIRGLLLISYDNQINNLAQQINLHIWIPISFLEKIWLLILEVDLGKCRNRNCLILLMVPLSKPSQLIQIHH